MVYYGIPERLHTDQGPDFESRLIKELCELTGIKKTHTTPYHPRGNPVERFNRTLLSMLGTLEPKQKSKWKEYVKPLVHAYNCTRNEVTGFTPYELMFGRSPRLPVDLAFGLPVSPPQTRSHNQYVQSLRSRLQEGYQLAAKNAARSMERNKARFDKRVIPSVLEVGDRVLVRNVRIRGKHKLEDKWERDVYVVVKRAGDLPVYTVCPEKDMNGSTRTLHRDLLLPCGFLSASVEDESSGPDPVHRPRTRSQPQTATDVLEGLVDEETDDLLSLPGCQPTRFSIVHLPSDEWLADPVSDTPASSPSNSALVGSPLHAAPVTPDSSTPQLPAVEKASPAAEVELSCGPVENLPMEENLPVEGNVPVEGHLPVEENLPKDVIQQDESENHDPQSDQGETCIQQVEMTPDRVHKAAFLFSSSLLISRCHRNSRDSDVSAHVTGCCQSQQLMLDGSRGSCWSLRATPRLVCMCS